MAAWIAACRLDEIEPEGAVRFDHEGRTFTIFRSPEDEGFRTDGLCTHEAVHLAGGLVVDHEVECPRHSGVFDDRTGQARCLPACLNPSVPGGGGRTTSSAGPRATTMERHRAPPFGAA